MKTKTKSLTEYQTKPIKDTVLEKSKLKKVYGGAHSDGDPFPEPSRP
ncbi:hypothetical protein [Aquimarina sp. 2304DJ70-9]